ncbi:MAG TPA: IPTL-CTERM sorting domain-containing protein [Steroidobacteraceae bacterium]
MIGEAMKTACILGVALFASGVAVEAAAYTFTTCGATGAQGPTQAQCDTAYGGAITVTVNGGIQSWTVPASGTYHIVATGAQGGSGSLPSFVGGRGAQVSGDFALTAGQVLKLVVGQAGTNGGTENGGGGGGSFVVSSSNAAMLIAGGGGGIRAGASQNGCDASLTQFAVTGSGGNPTSTCALEATDLGLGGIVSSSSWGSAGAGFNGDGATDFGTHSGGYSWANGMLGGTTDETCSTSAPGGFGGGGAGNGCWGGGGGGGYSGGDGGWIAGGGGSFNSGTSPTAVVATAPTGIVITLAAPAIATAVPTLSQWGIVALGGLLALTALVALRRRAG